MATDSPAEVKIEKIKGMDKWEAENAADTLMRSFEIKRNKKLLGAALAVIRRRQKDAKQAAGWAGGMN